MGSATGQKKEKPWIETPLIQSLALSRAAGCNIFLKLENLQPSGSFKSRGIGNLILSQIDDHRQSGTSKSLHFFTSSGGNAGLACVTAARTLGYPATVVVPTSTSPMMMAKIKAAGALEVIQTGASWFYADQHLREDILPALKAKGEVEGVYVPPFDHPAIWDGYTTMTEEISRQLPTGGKPDALICSIGGGGLFSGLMQGLDILGWNDVPVLAMETIGADSLYQSVQAGKLVTLPGITSLALCLGAVRVAPKAFEYAQRKNVTSVALPDAEAAMGTCRLADDERLLVELACGVSIAPCYSGLLPQLVPGLSPDSRVVVIVCGGSNITPEIVADYRPLYAK